MVGQEYMLAISRVNKMIDAATRDDDRMLARDLKRANDYLAKNYNRLADVKNPVNVQVMSHYNKLIEIAFRHSDDRIAEQNKDAARMVNNLLDAAEKVR